MSKGDDLIARIAEGIADGRAIDWSVERDVDPMLRSKLRNLRAIAQVNAIYKRGPFPPRAGDTGEMRATIPIAPSRLGETSEESDGEALERWGRLRLLKRVGVGSYGEVYRARDPALDREVALKLLRPEASRAAADGVIHEAKQLARVRHPNVLTVHGAEEREGRVGIWSDYIEGKTLEECLREQGPFSAEEATLIGIDLLRAIAAVHAAGLVHRDIKAANVMREKGGRIVLMDFGTAIDRRASEEGTDLAGTAVYLAPELFRGGSGGIAADIYSVGVLIFRLVTGRYPVDGATVADLANKHRSGESARLRDLRPELPGVFVQAVEAALRADPCQRYRTAGEFEQALAGPTALVDRAGAKGARRSWILVAAVAGCAIAAALIAERALTPGALGVEAALFRNAGGADERLRDGASIGPGDRLFMEIEASAKSHVYVFNEDSRGDAYLLYPLTGLDPANPLEGGVKHRLPGEKGGMRQYWNVTSSGGHETVYVIASRGPLEDLERSLASLPQAGSGSPLALSGADLGLVLRGIGGISAEPASGAEASRPGLSGVFSRLEAKDSGSRRLWTWKVELENP